MKQMVIQDDQKSLIKQGTNSKTNTNTNTNTPSLDTTSILKPIQSITTNRKVSQKASCPGTRADAIPNTRRIEPPCIVVQRAKEPEPNRSHEV
ncbi:hypothetical protein N7509_001794 [Penicillium cosmopolitanum]|uniref:Uncharacterized protein n=1 Tax=Penicillium cosmopolitanum TaxID=1131564 RepID=A0A9X0BCS6_9EURO|nr:uncharacterized protein N7509_001794 [Penicillium cosmopolitanum]KAJ5407911.1 hypothetical protein N7509_001794 [Penicillium cosmopolitanum]